MINESGIGSNMNHPLTSNGAEVVEPQIDIARTTGRGSEITKEIIVIDENNKQNVVHQPIVMEDLDDTTYVPIKARINDYQGKPIEVEVMVSVSDLNKAAESLQMPEPRTFRKYITRETLLEKYNEITENDLDIFFEYLPDELSQDMTVYIVGYTIMKSVDKSVTFRRLKYLINMLETGIGTVSEHDQKIAEMYKTYINMTRDSIIDGFKWVTRAPRRPGKQLFLNRNTDVYETALITKEGDAELKRKLTENMKSKGKNVYGKRSDNNRMLSVSLSPQLYQMVKIAKTCYKGNLTAFISNLLIEDADRHGYIYDEVLRECLSEEEYEELLKENKIKSIDDLVTDIKSGVWS